MARIRIGIQSILGIILWLSACTGFNSPGMPARSLTSTTTPGQESLHSLSPTPDVTAIPADTILSPAELETLRSLRQIDEYPLYTMRYTAAYDLLSVTQQTNRPVSTTLGINAPGWACSLFAALGSRDQMLYGRNFDWSYSPALLLYTAPPEGYASISLVDLAGFPFSHADPGNLSESDPEALKPLLMAHRWPFDGLNENGLAIGMAAVPPGNVPHDPEKNTLGSLGVMRVVLDGARDINEGVAILQANNIDFSGGPPIHYLLADRSGNSALVEHAAGKVNVLYNRHPWQQATNFLLSTETDPQGRCWRYDHLDSTLRSVQGRLDPAGALDLLAAVAQENTQWSVVYDLTSLELQIVMGRNYTRSHRISWEQLASP